MNILIVDDEPLARDRLKRLLEQLPQYNLMDTQASNGPEAIALCKAHQPDIVLLDIQMPGINGIDVATALNTLPQPPAIIFCTAHEEFALEAFQVNAIGYLVKPVRLEQLTQALSQAERLSPKQLHALQDTASEHSQPRTHISAKTHKGIECIALDSILYCVAEHKYVTVYHAGGETLIDESLKALETEFPERFMRIHRSTLVNIAFIDRLERTANGQHLLHLKNSPTPLAISRRHVASVRTLMHRF